jgi:signal transduction histidine kinase
MPASSTPSAEVAPDGLAALADRAHRLNHDLRTPIGTMATALDLLRDGRVAFGGDDLETLDVLQRQVDKLTSLAEVLRDFAVDLDQRARNPPHPD